MGHVVRLGECIIILRFPHSSPETTDTALFLTPHDISVQALYLIGSTKDKRQRHETDELQLRNLTLGCNTPW